MDKDIHILLKFFPILECPQKRFLLTSVDIFSCFIPRCFETRKLLLQTAVVWTASEAHLLESWADMHRVLYIPLKFPLDVHANISLLICSPLKPRSAVLQDGPSPEVCQNCVWIYTSVWSLIGKHFDHLNLWECVEKMFINESVFILYYSYVGLNEWLAKHFYLHSSIKMLNYTVTWFKKH